jgi:hypothetical protein
VRRISAPPTYTPERSPASIRRTASARSASVSGNRASIVTASAKASPVGAASGVVVDPVPELAESAPGAVGELVPPSSVCPASDGSAQPVSASAEQTGVQTGAASSVSACPSAVCTRVRLPFKPWVVGSSPTALSSPTLDLCVLLSSAQDLTASAAEVSPLAVWSAFAPGVQRFPAFGTSAGTRIRPRGSPKSTSGTHRPLRPSHRVR